MFQTLRKKNRCIVGQLLTGASLLMLLSQAVAAEPRLSRMTRIATTARTEPSGRTELRPRPAMMELGSAASGRTQSIGPGFRLPASITPVRRADGGNVFVPAGNTKPRLVTTKLEIRTRFAWPSSKWWSNSRSMLEPQEVRLRWKTGEASAVAGRWVLYNTMQPTERTSPIASGHLSTVPPGGQWGFFEVDLAKLLPADPALEVRYWMRVSPIGEQKQAVGPASSWVRITIKHPPPDLAATSCKLKHEKVDWGQYTVTCRITKRDPYPYSGNRTFAIIRRAPDALPTVVKSGPIPPISPLWGTFTTSFTGYGGNPVGSYFQLIISSGDEDPANDQCTSQ